MEPGNEKISDFLVAKTFAWGGIYGASTSMEDIERTFADGVAAALTEQQDAKKQDAKKVAAVKPK
jgi:hypothetical protein